MNCDTVEGKNCHCISVRRYAGKLEKLKKMALAKVLVGNSSFSEFLPTWVAIDSIYFDYFCYFDLKSEAYSI